MVEVHNYAPMDFTFVADWNEATRSSIWKESFCQQLSYEIDILQEFQQKWKLTAKYGIKTFLWDDGGNMGTFNRHRAAFDYPEIVQKDSVTAVKKSIAGSFVGISKNKNLAKKILDIIYKNESCFSADSLINSMENRYCLCYTYKHLMITIREDMK